MCTRFFPCERSLALQLQLFARSVSQSPNATPTLQPDVTDAVEKAVRQSVTRILSRSHRSSQRTASQERSNRSSRSERSNRSSRSLSTYRAMQSELSSGATRDSSMDEERERESNRRHSTYRKSTGRRELRERDRDGGEIEPDRRRSRSQQSSTNRRLSRTRAADPDSSRSFGSSSSSLTRTPSFTPIPSHVSQSRVPLPPSQSDPSLLYASLQLPRGFERQPQVDIGDLNAEREFQVPVAAFLGQNNPFVMQSDTPDAMFPYFPAPQFQDEVAYQSSLQSVYQTPPQHSVYLSPQPSVYQTPVSPQNIGFIHFNAGQDSSAQSFVSQADETSMSPPPLPMNADGSALIDSDPF